MRLLDKVKDFRVLVVGDAIMDEYYYVTAIGKSIKENVISTKLERMESFRGGVWAAAEHIKDFCAQVDVLTGVNVMANWRFVDETYTRKLFTVHEHRHGTYPIEHDIKSYDVVIVTDFGHGALTKPLIERLSKEARFLAVNAQTNSTNYGFNLITKYPRADYVVVDELEARLATHEKEAPIEEVILKLGFPRIVVTLGANGAVGYDGAFVKQSALTNKVADTMGAGDAFLCVSSPFAAAGVPMADLVRIGNAAGAVKVGIIGHRNHVTRTALEAQLATL